MSADPDHLANRRDPATVPVLADAGHRVVLRGHRSGDVAMLVEQCRDADSIRWTTVPVPAGGYGPADAEAYLAHVAEGWRSGTQLSWAIEDAGRPGAFCGSIDLRLGGAGTAEVGFGLHPAARGRHLMSAALRLVCNYAFDTAGLRVLRWRAVVGHWGSRRVAAAAGFAMEGTLRSVLVHRGELLDGWVASITATDPRTSLGWSDPPLLGDDRLRLRSFTDADADRVVEACSDPRTQHWLVSLPRTYTPDHALRHVEATREAAAHRSGLAWCVADAADDRCLGSVTLDGLEGYARRAEIGYWSHPDARGQGLTTRAVRLVTAYAEGADLVDSILIRVAAGNTASRRVAEAAGYRHAGVQPHSEPVGDGGVVDLHFFSRP